MKNLLYFSLVLIISIFLALIIMSSRLQIPPDIFVSMIPEMIYSHAHVNGFYGNSSAFYSLIYILISISFIIGYLLFLVRKPKDTSLFNYIKKQTFFILGLIIIYTSLIQTIRNFAELHNVMIRFEGLNTDEKLKNMYGKPYDYASKIKPLLPARSQCQLITDLDISRSTGMSLERYFAYFLYPVQVRYIDEEPDCLVFMSKKNAQEHVPENFSTILSYDSNNLFAIRN